MLHVHLYMEQDLSESRRWEDEDYKDQCFTVRLYEGMRSSESHTLKTGNLHIYFNFNEDKDTANIICRLKFIMIYNR